MRERGEAMEEGGGGWGGGGEGMRGGGGIRMKADFLGVREEGKFGWKILLVGDDGVCWGGFVLRRMK